MSDYTTIHFSLLEHLPDELLLDLFEQYISVVDLYRGFLNLNQRINGLLKSLDKIKYSLSSNSWEIATPYISSRIVRLVISHPFPFSLNPFINLRSLTLKKANNDQFQKICSGFISPYLTYLRLILLFNHEVLNHSNTFINLFSNRFKFLRKLCILGKMNIPPTTLSACSSTPSLRSISINISKNLYLYSTILSTCPNLVRLELRVSFINISLDFYQHSNLKYLRLQLMDSNWSFHTFKHFLSCVPTVERLVIQRFRPNTDDNGLRLDHIRFAQILTQYLPLLHQFDCDILFDSSKFAINISHIHQLHSYFTRIQIEHQQNGIVRLFTTI
ncbi:unnamed protein product [Rotaria sp. Silwood2]|nr:unnamed protein product [Rotaria sp. Silwood2]CAF3336652.1 unnamed protein product [Rotaria sp. Silwood2]CAF4524695.1 unnamed protein product [Rotaria sp. Silwood2]CAF4606761.1 unnamed protein product [Rotaria sp. Silwood2]